MIILIMFGITHGLRKIILFLFYLYLLGLILSKQGFHLILLVISRIMQDGFVARLFLLKNLIQGIYSIIQYLWWTAIIYFLFCIPKHHQICLRKRNSKYRFEQTSLVIPFIPVLRRRLILNNPVNFVPIPSLDSSNRQLPIIPPINPIANPSQHVFPKLIYNPYLQTISPKHKSSIVRNKVKTTNINSPK